MSPQATDRITGLDILRSLAMLMIVIWHFYFHAMGSAVFPGTVPGTINYLVSQFIVVCCCVCVNVFVLISSYFLVEKPFNASRLLRLWLQVVFYAVGISLLFSLIFPGTFSWKESLNGLFPISSYIYWFFSVYFGFTLLAPFLSKAATSLSQKEFRVFLLVLVILCCTFTFIIPLGNTMGAAKGYSLLWFIALFFWGAYFKRFDVFPGKKHLGWYFWLCIGVTLFCIGKSLLRLRAGAEGAIVELPAYNGFAFILSVPLFLYFKEKRFRDTFVLRTILAVVPYTFGVYLISDHPRLRELLWYGDIPWASLMNSFLFIPVILATCFGIFLICAGGDYLRSLLFKVLGIPRLCTRLCHKIDSFFIDLRK